jgi:hypothetical protein
MIRIYWLGIHVGEKIHAGEEHVLFEAIRRRRTNRQAFERREVPAAILAALQKAAHVEGAWLIMLQTEDDCSAVADLIALGDRVQLRDKHFRRELPAIAFAHGLWAGDPTDPRRSVNEVLSVT